MVFDSSSPQLLFSGVRFEGQRQRRSGGRKLRTGHRALHRRHRAGPQEPRTVQQPVGGLRQTRKVSGRSGGRREHRADQTGLAQSNYGRN